MRTSNHVIASTVFSSGLYCVTKSPVISVSSFLIGIFLDIDHLIDYWRQHPGSLDYYHFIETCEKYRLQLVTLFLHSYELLLACVTLVFFTKSALLFGISLGFAQHLFFDTITNSVNDDHSSYFFLYRWYVGFDIRKVFNTDKINGKDSNL